MDEILRRLGEIETEMRELHEAAGDEALTAEQQARWTELEEQRTEQLRLQEEERARQADLDRRRSAVAGFAARGTTEAGDGNLDVRGVQVMQCVDPWDGADVRALPDLKARDKALKALEDPSLTEHADDEQLARAIKVLRTRTRDCNGAHVARRLLITETEHYRNAFMKLITRAHPVLTPEEQHAVEVYEEYRAMSIGSDPGGGFGVPVLIDPTIMLVAQGSPNDILNLARVETITNDEWKGVSSAGVSWSFDPESAEVSDDSPTLAQPTVPAHKAQGYIPYTIEVGMDYPGFASEMSVLLDEGYRELLAQKLTTGSGTNEPTGVVTKLDATPASEVTVTTDGVFGAVDIYKLWDALPIKYRNRMPSWMSSTDVMNEVRQFGSGGSGGSNFSVNLTQESIPKLFGKNYYENDFMDDFTSTTGAANLVVLGDFKNYLIAQRAGMSVELVPHVFGNTNNRPIGQRAWYAWARVGADVINTAGFRLLQNQ
ncbi:phage major capsid protein [Spongiactinospora gelatinilytica]|uniref:Phage major capsid protein n=1 Tax=Spongiactinospora gelatinilytica TaxID=2666298 RepID=A0A2W2GXI2_9ACTN|nr:phage major capsid protein [Spongiactinospora gelatinilytica]PZG53141.1 phage major capsid protein [Spongiactinospora gelatinilytica]